MSARKVGQAFVPVLVRRLERDCVDCARPHALSDPLPAAVKNSSDEPAFRLLRMRFPALPLWPAKYQTRPPT